MSYDPKVFFMICPFLNLDFKLLMGFSRFMGLFWNLMTYLWVFFSSSVFWYLDGF